MSPPSIVVDGLIKPEETLEFDAPPRLRAGQLLRAGEYAADPRPFTTK
jgi:hypothetical protein